MTHESLVQCLVVALFVVSTVSSYLVHAPLVCIWGFVEVWWFSSSKEA